jgi:cell division protein FtsB
MDSRMKNKTKARRNPADTLTNLVRHHAGGIILTACALLLIQDVFGAHGVLAMRRTQREAEQIRTELKLLDDDNRQLQERVKALGTDSAVECIARTEMGLSRPGEMVFRTGADGTTAAQAADTCAAPPGSPPTK